MSIWTFRRAALLPLAFALAGCLGEGGTGEGLSLLSDGLGTPRSHALASAELAPGAVVAKGPRGYCIDRRTLKTGVAGGFALIAPCNALGAEGAGTEGTGAGTAPALMTIQVQPRLLGKEAKDADGLAAAFAEEGPIYRETGDGLSIVQLSRGGNNVITDGDPVHWRAALSFNGYLIGLALYSDKGGIAAQDEGKALIIGFAEAVLSSSPIASAAPAE